ncbi:WD40 repeat-like protein, partial [Saccharata proteae CBS 121410]
AKKDAWYISDPSGGRFLPIHPVFSRDERYIMFANAKAVHIYSTVTSLLVRTLPVNSNHGISAYALSASNPTQLYVSDAAGFVALWNWVEGKKIGRWDLATRVCGMATTTVDEDGATADTVFTHEKDQSNTITAHRMRSRKEGKESEAVVLLRSKRQMKSFKVVGNGSVIVVAFPDSVMVGKVKEGAESFKGTTYVWREIKCAESVTTFDVRVGRQEVKGGQKTPRKGGSQNSKDSVNLAIGGSRGTIFCYEDILYRLIQAENPKKDTAPSVLVPRVFHWHRNAVGSVRWSLDGNYLLSGGQETVLVLWQLDTAKRQFLPHLTSPIDGMVVSPIGSSYAVQLADNSVIVLKTTDLTPKANIAGLQAHTMSLDQSAGEKDLLDEIHRVPAVVNPQRSSQLLLAVPVSQSRTEPNDTHLPAPFLQTYDISSNHHVSRQAITRNNATVFNIGGNMAPGATKLREPDVKHVQLSNDGSWLATVEEWLPPAADVEHLASDKAMTEEERRFRREVFLKFWQWDAEKQLWTLETRIDAPHQHPQGLFSGRVFDLAYDPISTEFATVGEDGHVRFWAPKVRLHDGTVVKGSKAEGLVTWSNRCSTRLETSGESLDAHFDLPVAQVPVNARLAYSPDASVLAASQEFYGTYGQGLVSFIDPSSGQIRYSRGGLYTTGLVDIGFVGRHFIIFSNSLSVWDLVDDNLSYGYSFRPLGLSRGQKAEIAHLAIHDADGTFAISLPAADRQTIGVVDPSKRQSRIVVFDPSNARPLYSSTVPKIVTALVPARGAKGFVAINTSAEIRVVAPKTSASLQLVAP